LVCDLMQLVAGASYIISKVNRFEESLFFTHRRSREEFFIINNCN